MNRLLSTLAASATGAALSVSMAHPGHEHDVAVSIASGHFHVFGGLIDIVALSVAGVALVTGGWFLVRSRLQRASTKSPRGDVR